MDLDVKEKVAFITGGGEGIGETVALMLAREGARIAVADIDTSKVEMTAKKIKELGAESLYFPLDVVSQNEVKEAVRITVKEFGSLDMLIHVPGRGERKPFSSSNKKDWDFSINLNLYGPLCVVKEVLEQMVKQQSGAIAFTVSDAGRVGENNNSVYSAAKAGVIALSKALAKEFGRHNIRVNCVSLSAMSTPAGLRYREKIAQSLGRDMAEIEKKVLSNYCLRRFGTPQDAANALCFLASDRASWITGQTLSVNGGYCMV